MRPADLHGLQCNSFVQPQLALQNAAQGGSSQQLVALGQNNLGVMSCNAMHSAECRFEGVKSQMNKQHLAALQQSETFQLVRKHLYTEDRVKNMIMYFMQLVIPDGHSAAQGAFVPIAHICIKPLNADDHAHAEEIVEDIPFTDRNPNE